jgi:hypothetical protein
MNQIVFIGGMGRSGSSMLSNILDSHPAIAQGPEVTHLDDIINAYIGTLAAMQAGKLNGVMNPAELRDTFSKLIAQLYAPQEGSEGVSVIVDRNPANIWNFPILAELLPNAKFIHIIRDGRDVACSHRDVGERLRIRGMTTDPLRQAAVSSIFHCAALWAETVRFGWDVCGPDSTLALTGRAFTTFYENIVMSPESQTRAICEFIGVPFATEMLYPERTKREVSVDEIWTTSDDKDRSISMLSAGRWIDHLPLTERIVFYSRGQVGLRTTGYDDSLDWLFRGMSVSVDSATVAVEQARAQLLGIAANAVVPTSQDVMTDARPRMALEKIVTSPVVDGAALGKPIPEIDALLRTAREAGHAYISR